MPTPMAIAVRKILIQKAVKDVKNGLLAKHKELDGLQKQMNLLNKEMSKKREASLVQDIRRKIDRSKSAKES